MSLAPRKRDASAARARILAAAQAAFATTGYSHTGIREIAAAAGTSSTLLLRYFGSKAGLFEAALHDAIAIDELVAMTPDEMARTLARTLREETDSARPMLMMAMASGEPEAAAIIVRIFTERSLLPMADYLGGEDGQVRALELAMLAIGYVFFMKHLPLPALSTARSETLDAWFTRAVLDVVRPG